MSYGKAVSIEDEPQYGVYHSILAAVLDAPEPLTAKQVAFAAQCPLQLAYCGLGWWLRRGMVQRENRGYRVYWTAEEIDD